jgi:CxxC motif-containing protein (DUF1111 family)
MRGDEAIFPASRIDGLSSPRRRIRRAARADWTASKEVRLKLRSMVLTLSLLAAAAALAQTDPGVRGGAAGAGGPLASVAADNPATILSFFNDAKARFQEIDSVSGTIVGEDGKGLGPRYNSRSCARCHAQPAVGGTSPSTNPEVADATADGATNTVPSFVLLNGPVKEARFIYFTDASGNPITSQPNGGVEPLYTIAGRPDAAGCTSTYIQQPNFASASSHNNVIFRIPTPVFGSGLIENVDDSALLTVYSTNSGNQFGVNGTFNRNGNDGTISRFGWKAQNKSLEIFSGEAYNVEQGVSNELFTQERPTPEEERALGLASQCRTNATPEDHTNFNTNALGTPSDAVMFAMFMRLLAPPAQNGGVGSQLQSVLNGYSLFTDVGCALCHHETFTTSASAFTPGLSSVSFKPYSDFQLHHMGTTLADNVQQGNAGGDQFRTAPLWGLGQRIWFLHDGRRSNLNLVIADHMSTGSEANSVILNYNTLSVSDKQDVLNFLRSL